MDIEEWWPELSESTKAWLQQNNGSPLTAEVSAEIAAAGGPSGAQLSDDDVDWLEAVSNDETPEG